MDIPNTSQSSVNTSLECSPKTSVKAKIRRLKIQEDLLIQNITKNFSYIGIAENGFIKSNLEFKKYLNNLKTPYNDIKLSFLDVKSTAKSQDILKNIDIDDVKEDVLALEDKFKKFKVFLQRELINLKSSEKNIIKELNEDIFESNKIKMKTRVTTKNYSDIVPSPVKTIMNSPFKCPEVQQFQDFLTNSSKYGGWNEYNHNVFIKLWQKYFKNEEDYFSQQLNNCCVTDLFINEAFEKIGGCRKADIVSHIKWYSKYLHLRKRQQFALDEWRTKTRPKKKQRIYEVQGNNDEKSHKKESQASLLNKRFETEKRGTQPRPSSSLGDTETFSMVIEERGVHDNVCANEYLKEMNLGNNATNAAQDLIKFRFAKPTKQWISKCNTLPDPAQFFNHNLDDGGKLGTPMWRRGLDKQ